MILERLRGQLVVKASGEWRLEVNFGVTIDFGSFFYIFVFVEFHFGTSCSKTFTVVKNVFGIKFDIVCNRSWRKK